MAEIVLVPGFWLGAWAWDRVAAPLREAGHTVTAVTLPGLESVDANRAGVTLEDHIEYVAAILEERRAQDVMLVGHSGAGSVIYGVTDRVPERVALAVYVDSGPRPDGTPFWDWVAADAPELEMPTWEEFERDGASLAGIDEAGLAEFRRRAVPHPAGPARDALRLSNPARFTMPTTLINCSIPSAEVQRLIAEGAPLFAEVGRLRFVRHVDLPTGHWPMFSRPADLATLLGRIAEEVDVAVASAEF